ncbi:MAG: adenylate/guanylate cyclase domain-containing protein [Chloroflexota bacterium]|nr:adenylate/guanylate cyclase domain-containing protein [Chloroflexota bacterium]
MRERLEHADRTMRLGRVAMLFVLVVVVVAFLAVHVLAWRWATEPFLGLLLDPTLVLSSLQGRGWARLQFDPPLEQPDRLIAIDGRPVERYADVEAILSEHAVGDTVWVLVTRPDGNQREEQITLTPFLLKDLFLIFIVPYLVGMAYLGIGIWVYWVQGWGQAGQVFTGLCAALALVLGCVFDISTTHRLPILWGAAVPFAAAAAIHLALVFPQEPHFARRLPVLRLLPYLLATFLAVRSASSVYDFGQPWEYISRWRNSYLFAAVGILFLLGMLVYRLVRPPSPLVRQQSRIILLGSTLAFLPVVPWLLLNVLGQPVPFITPLFAPLFALFPLSISYAILRYRLMDIDQLLSRGLAYGALTFLIVVAYFALTNGLSHFFAVKTSDPILLSLFVLTLVLLFNPLRSWAQRLVDRAFFREEVDYETMQTLSHELAQTLDVEAALARIVKRVEDTLSPIHQWVFMYDEGQTCYVGQPTSGGKHTLSPVISVPDGMLAHWLRNHREPLYLPAERDLQAELSDEWARVNALGAVVYVPLHAQERLSGWLALGPKRSGQPYRYDDLAFLSTLAEQSSPVLENARLFAILHHNLAASTEAKNLMEDVFSSIASGVITTDVQDKVIFFNRAAETILGMQADDVIDRPCHHVLRSLGNGLHHVVSSVKSGEIPMTTYEVQPTLPARGTVWLRVKLSPLKDSRDVITGVAIVVDDLTERRQLEAMARRIRGTFERYVSPVVVEQMLSNPESIRLGGVRQDITSFYADIRRFTAFSEKTTPEFQIEVLNRHLTLVVGAILAYEGTLDKFVGDGAMAIFNAPIAQEDHTMRALRAALATRQAVREHHADVDEQERLHFGIGVTVGQAVVGNIGSAVLHNFTAIGDCVNVSSRLSSIAEPGQILISAETYDRVKDHVETNFIGHVYVKGHSQPEPVYEVLRLKSEDNVS